jgi:hypothetical protein
MIWVTGHPEFYLVMERYDTVIRYLLPRNHYADPGSGREQIRIRDKHPESYFRQLSNNFWVEILISLSIQCCGTGFGIRCLFDPGSGMEKSRFWILDKHTGSGTMPRKSPFTPSAEYWYGMRWLKYRSSVISSDLYTGRRRQRRHLHQR